MRRVFLIGLLSLSACAGARPGIPPAAAVSTPPAWRTQPADQGTTIAMVSDDWWHGFDDPQLDSLVATALANSSELETAAARVQEAHAAFRAAQGVLQPTLGAGGGVDRSQILGPFGVAQLGTGQEISIDASYELDFFGKLSNLKGAARAQLLATEATRDNIRLAVISATVSGYINLVALDSRLNVLQSTLTSREKALRIVDRKSSDGYSPKLEEAQAEAEYQATKQLIPLTELAIRKQEDGLCLLIGQNPGSIERAADLSALRPLPIPSTLPSELLRRRPDVVAAEEQIVAADHSLDAARAAFMPSIALSANDGFVNSTLIPKGVDTYGLSGGFFAPIFEGGRLHAQANAATSRRDQAAFAYRRTVLNAFREVEDSMATVGLTQAQATDLEAQKVAMSEGLRLATGRFQAGYSSYLEQLDAERGLLSVELALVQSRADRLNAYVSLYQSLGGGWDRGQLAQH